MPAGDRPNSRERRVLEQFAGEPEQATAFPGAGPQTLRAMLEKGWIEERHDPAFGGDCYVITQAGEDALYR